MDGTRQLSVVIVADAAQAKAAMAELGGATAAAADASGANLAKIGTSLGALGKAIMPVSIAMAAVGAYSVKSAMDFQASMTLIQTQAGASAGEVKKLTGSVLDMSTQVGEKPNELAKGLFFIESAGFRGAKALDVLRLAAEGAQVGNANLADTANALTSVMNTNIQGAQSATEAMGNLNAIVGAGKMHFEDLNAAISTGFLSTAANFGVSLQSAGAALASLTDAGMPAEAAATRLRMAMTLMATPTEKAQNVLTGLGFSMTDAKAGSDSMTAALAKAHVTTSQLSDDLRKPNGFDVAIQDLKKHLQESGLSADAASSAIAAAFGGGRSSAPIMAMLQNTQQLGDAFDKIRTNSDKFGEDWAARQQDASFKWDIFKATIQKDAIVIGDELLPKLTTALTHIGNAITDVTKWWNSLGQIGKTVISDLAIGLAVSGPLLMGMSKLISSAEIVYGLFQKIAATKAITGLAGAVSGGAGMAGAVAGEGAALGGAAAAGGETAAIAGGATAATGAVAGLGAALGGLIIPIGLVAAAGIATAIVVNRLATEHRNAAAAAKAQADASAENAQKILTTSGAQQQAAKNVQTYKSALDTAKTSVDNLKTAHDAATTKLDAFQKAQDGAHQALVKYGQDSPQYIKAVEAEAKAGDASTKATDAYNKMLGINKTAHDNVVTSLKDINPQYFVTQQNQGKLSELTGHLNDVKNQEHDAHDKVKEAVKGYTAALQLTGPNSDATKEASKKLADAQEHEHNMAQSAKNAQHELDQLHKNMQGEIHNLQGALSGLAGSYNGVAGAAQNAAAQEKNAANQPAPSSSVLPHHAAGTDYAPGGWSIVGEDGPELINLPRGSTVLNNNNTQNVLGGGGGGDIHVTIQAGTVVGANGAQDLANMVYRELQRIARANGFNGALPEIGILPT